MSDGAHRLSSDFDPLSGGTVTRGSALTTALVAAAISMSIILAGVYAVTFANLSLFAGLVFLVASILPGGYFMLLAWGIGYGAITGRRPPSADRINSFFARANQPLGTRRRR